MFRKSPEQDPLRDRPDPSVLMQPEGPLPYQIDISDHLHWILDLVGGPEPLLVNPIFLKLYRRMKIRIFFGPEKTIMAGLYWSIVVNLLLLILIPQPHRFYTSTVLFFFPAALLLLFIAARLAFLTLFTAPLRISGEVEKGVMQSVYATPVSDSEIYYGTSMPSLVRGLEAYEEIFAFLAGSALPCIIFNIPVLLVGTLNSSFKISTEPFYYFLTGTIFMVIFIFLSALLASRATGLYMIFQLRFGIAIPGLLHVILAWLASVFAALLVIYPYSFSLTGSFSPGIWAILIASCVINVVLWFACDLTARIGLSVLKRTRQRTDSAGI